VHFLKKQYGGGGGLVIKRYLEKAGALRSLPLDSASAKVKQKLSDANAALAKKSKT